MSCPGRIKMEQTFDEKVKSSTLPVVVDFWAPWCAPCKMMKPAIANVMKEFDNQFLLIEVNTDEEQELTQRFNIKSIPTLIGYNQGKEVARRVGGLSARDVRAFFLAVQKGEAFTGIDSQSRTFRLIATAVLFYLAVSKGFNWVVLIMAVGMLIFATYDKLPLKKVQKWFKERRGDSF